ncbi:MAG: alpha/beta hydrolase [Acidobacteriota bacterium]
MVSLADLSPRRRVEILRPSILGAPTHVELHHPLAEDDDASSRTPILALHGNPDSAQLWRPFADRAPDRLLIAPDLPGLARSRRPAGLNYRLDEMVAWLDGVLNATGTAGPLHLIGHDFGGVFLGAWAVAHPERVRSATLVDTIFHPEYRWHAWARVWRTPILGEVSMLAMNAPLFHRELRRGGPGLTRAWRNEAWRQVTPEAKGNVLALYRATDPDVFRPQVEALRAVMRSRPSLTVWGADDPYIDPSWAHRYGARRAVVLEACGHWPPVERPDAFAAAVLETIREAERSNDDGTLDATS